MQCFDVKALMNGAESELETVDISLNYCVPPSGNFGMPSEAGNFVQSWDHCREQFAVKFTECTKTFFYTHEAGMGQSVAHFIVRFENVVRAGGYNSFRGSSFAKTSYGRILMCNPSDFWLGCYYRRSLLTLLLRCALNYRHDLGNFDDALFGPQHKENQYIRDTKDAVMRFMYGFTKFTGGMPASSGVTVIKHGWKEEFDGLGSREIRSRLVAPVTSRSDYNMVGADSLWM